MYVNLKYSLLVGMLDFDNPSGHPLNSLYCLFSKVNLCGMVFQILC